jgi:ribonuclease Z
MRYLIFSLSALSAFFSNPLSAQTPATQQIVITFLGTSGPSMTIERAESGTLIQAGGETFLFDCGRGVPERLVQAGIRGVDKVFLTHLHSDHTQGLPILWMSSWNSRNTKLSLWGPGTGPDQPTGTVGLAQSLTTAFATNTHIRRDLVEKWSAEKIIIDAHDIEEGIVYQAKGITVTAFRVKHDPVTPAFGYRVDYAGRSVVVSGDTRPSDNLIKFSKDADVLIHEVFVQGGQPNGMTSGMTAAPGMGTANNSSTINPVAAYHTTPEEAAEIFNKTSPRLAVFSHIAPNYVDPTDRARAAGYTGPLQVAKDLMVITVGETISVK